MVDLGRLSRWARATADACDGVVAEVEADEANVQLQASDATDEVVRSVEMTQRWWDAFQPLDGIIRNV